MTSLHQFVIHMLLSCFSSFFVLECALNIEHISMFNAYSNFITFNVSQEGDSSVLRTKLLYNWIISIIINFKFRQVLRKTLNSLSKTILLSYWRRMPAFSSLPIDGMQKLAVTTNVLVVWNRGTCLLSLFVIFAFLELYCCYCSFLFNTFSFILLVLISVLNLELCTPLTNNLMCRSIINKSKTSFYCLKGKIFVKLFFGLLFSKFFLFW